MSHLLKTIAVAGVLYLSLGGCSLIVSTSIDGLPCFNNKSSPNTPQCQEGYSCDGDQCVADHSVAAGSTCSKTQQCQTELVCPPGIYICRKPCQKIYQFGTSECSADQVCAPVYDTDGKHFSGGACIDKECSTGPEGDTFCQTNKDNKFAPAGSAANPFLDNRCVKLTGNGGLCLMSCKVGLRSEDTKATSDDSCGVDSRNNVVHCGIINNAGGGTPDFVCLPTGAATAGQSCTLFPLSGANALDACADNYPLQPLVCMADDGTLSGTLKCQQVCLPPSKSVPDACTGGNETCQALNSNNGTTNTTLFSYCATNTR